MNEDVISYYNARAREYDKVYQNPDEQEDLQTATALFQQLFAKKAVLEVACGTGYWTEVIATTVTSIVATDINESVINIAKIKQTRDNVCFELSDMFHLSSEKKFDGLFGGFIWSHILLQDLDGWIAKLHDHVFPGGIMAFIDSNPLVGTHHDIKHIAKTDSFGNTYQLRNLEDGTQHLLLKNFPTKDFLQQKLSAIGTDITYTQLKHYWIVCCTVQK
ncbi:MAG: class I SAM-dependent methyltransferase [Chitinophagales bacterium]|nr:class I SAM-dependent methyltransferase [Chitinophagales bacterium]